MWTLGTVIFFSVNSLAICVGPSPEIHSLKIKRTTSAASSSTIHFELSSGLFIYPYGTVVDSGFPDCPFDLKLALIFLLVSFAYHSLMMFKNGVKSLSC